MKTRWAQLSTEQRDAVRKAVYSIHPFVGASSEGGFLRMFTALEGLASTWFPKEKTLAEKVQAFVLAFPPQRLGLWPIVGPDRSGLNAIRNHLAHGNGITGMQYDALSAGSEHLQVWIEGILLTILGYYPKRSYRDWLTRHVQNQANELPKLRVAFR